VTGDEVAEPSDTLSAELEAAVEQQDKVTIGGIADALEERSFGLVLAVLLFPSALPIPTGGVTHLLELAALLVVVQMIAGRKELWLPKWARHRELGPTFRDKTIPAIVRRIRWFERFARPRMTRVLDMRVTVSLLGVVLFAFVVAALASPPFSGLDTLPSLGVVLVCLGLLFGDMAIVVAGLLVGTTGIALVIALGRAALSLF
jgi:hypothetical protein